MHNLRSTPVNLKGFTLLEVTLFLAISATLVVIAVAGLGPRIRNVRFTSSVRTLENAVTQNFNQGLSTENNRTAGRSCTTQVVLGVTSLKVDEGSSDAGATGTCVIVGRAIRFEDTRFTSRPIIALREPLTSCTAGDTLQAFLDCYKPIIHDNSSENKTITYDNGLRLSGVEGQAANTSMGFGYLIHPQTNQRFIVQFKKTGTYWNSFSGSITATGDLQAQTSYSTAVCFVLDSRRTRLTFTQADVNPVVAMNEGCSS